MVSQHRRFTLALWLILTPFILAACGGGSSSSSDSTAEARVALSKIDPSEPCRTLFAGQTIDVGSVCLDLDSHYLYVTYTTEGGWTLNEVHLFVGESLDDLPGGLGLFPYTAEDLNVTEFEIKVPLDDLNTECGATIAIAAHAAVSRDTGDGTQQETAWADGDPLNDFGWATGSEFLIDCDDEEPPPPPVCEGAETAYAVGDTTFEELMFGNWGWQITVAPGDDAQTPLYAGAGQHDLDKGTHVGTVSYTYDGSVLMLEYETFEGYGLLETHVYAGAEPLATNAPGQFGNTESPDTPATSLTTTVAVSGDPIYVAAHGVVVELTCEAEPEEALPEQELAEGEPL